ncbi:MAG: hypothetical protein ACFFB2_02355 [Promethearchaeota archaeon]
MRSTTGKGTGDLHMDGEQRKYWENEMKNDRDGIHSGTLFTVASMKTMGKGGKSEREIFK